MKDWKSWAIRKLGGWTALDVSKAIDNATRTERLLCERRKVDPKEIQAECYIDEMIFQGRFVEPDDVARVKLKEQLSEILFNFATVSKTKDVPLGRIRYRARIKIIPPEQGVIQEMEET